MIDEITWQYMTHVYRFADEDEFQDYLDYLDYINSDEEVFDTEENS